LDLATVIAWIIYRGVRGEEMSRHAFLHQLAEELREVYKEKCEYMVPKHNEEKQSQDERKASKRHQCQVGIVNATKQLKNVKYVSNMYVESARNCRKEILLQEMHAVTLLKISLIVSDVSWYRPI